MQYGEDSPLYGDETVSRRDRVGTCMQTRYRCRFRTAYHRSELHCYIYYVNSRYEDNNVLYTPKSASLIRTLSQV